MSNYTTENLIPIPPEAVPAGTLALKVGDLIFTPGNIRIGQSTDFYKCASVDTANKTWTGYKAVLADGAYSFEQTATAGLTYGNGLYPAIDGIYDAEAIVYVNRLWMGAAAVSEGLVIHAPLQYRAETAETGQAITYVDSALSFGSVANVSCVTFSKGTVIKIAEDLAVNSNPVTVSYWVRYPSPSGDIYVGWEHWNGYHLQIGRNGSGVMYVDGAGQWGGDYSETSVKDDNWHNVCLVWDGSSSRYYTLYLDGVEIIRNYEKNDPRAGEGTSEHIEVSGGAGTSFADVRIYNRALDVNEVALLAANLPA